MSGYDWHRSDDRDRNAAARSATVASAPGRLDAALNRIADALVNVTMYREGLPAPASSHVVVPPEASAIQGSAIDRETIARVEQRLDSAIAMLRGVLQAPPVLDSLVAVEGDETVADSDKPEEQARLLPERRDAPSAHDPNHHDS